MTDKVFWSAPYLRTLEASVTDATDAEIRLDRTIIFACSGGQESDHATINGIEILAARKSGAEIYYQLPAGHGLQTGNRVTLVIDWPRRYRLMRLHFAAELVLEICTQQLEGLEKIGAHITEQKARIDFSWPESLAPRIIAIQQLVAEKIAADLNIDSGFSDLQQEKRYWQITGFARVACGGTHLQRTGEIGAIRLKRSNLGKSKERIEIYLA